MKKILMKFLFTFVAVVGLSLSVSAQKNGQQKPKPPKEAPTIDPGKKPPPRDDRDKKPKKPGMAFVLVVESTEPQQATAQ